MMDIYLTFHLTRIALSCLLKDRGRSTEGTFHLLVHSLNTYNSQGRPGWTQAPRVQSSLSGGPQGSKCLSHHRSLPGCAAAASWTRKDSLQSKPSIPPSALNYEDQHLKCTDTHFQTYKAAVSKTISDLMQSYFLFCL